MIHDELTKKIIGCAYVVHNTLGAGFLEKVYENALLFELRSEGLDADRQASLKVEYKGIVVGEYFADLVVEGKVICELKAIEKLSSYHEVQLVNYLVATRIDIGLLINFGESVTVRRKFRKYKRTGRIS